MFGSGWLEMEDLICHNCNVDLDRHSQNDIKNCMSDYAKKAIRNYKRGK